MKVNSKVFQICTFPLRFLLYEMIETEKRLNR
jgi:hypothetical protein